MTAPNRPMMTGKINPNTKVPSLIQILRDGKQTGMLYVTNEDSSVQGTIIFDSGKVPHATCGDEQGERALIHLLGIMLGSYDFYSGAVPYEQTVTRSIEAIMISAIRNMNMPEPPRIAGEQGLEDLVDLASFEPPPTLPRHPDAANTVRPQNDKVSVAPPPDLVPTLTTNLNNLTLSGQEWHLFSQIDGQRSVRELTQMNPHELHILERHVHLGHLQLQEAMMPISFWNSLRVITCGFTGPNGVVLLMRAAKQLGLEYEKIPRRSADEFIEKIGSQIRTERRHLFDEQVKALPR